LIKKMRNDLFRIQVPLPGIPLGDLNVYVIRSPERNLIIDTGMDHKVSRALLLKSLSILEINLDQTDIFLTHQHADHIGLVKDLIRDNTSIYCQAGGWDFIHNWNGFDAMFQFAEINGFPKGVMQTVFKDHPGHIFRCTWHANPIFPDEGDVISIGDYKLTCVPTPGHSPDSQCLYEPDLKILFSGDHLLGEITPNIHQCCNENENPLKDYFKSLEKVAEMEIVQVFPGHREFDRNPRERIKELLSHHSSRLNHIITLVSDSPKTAFQIASGMKWNIGGDSWKRYPWEQKWLATVEIIAHVHYLEARGKLKKETVQGIIYYSI